MVQQSHRNETGREVGAGGGAYEGRKDEASSIISILALVAEDFEREMTLARSQEAEAQEAYDKERSTLATLLNAQKESLASEGSMLADLGEKIASTKANGDQ